MAARPTRVVRRAAAASVLLLSLAACGGGSSSAGGTSSPTSKTGTSSPAAASADGTLAISGGDDFRFDPAELTAKSGTDLKIAFSGKGSYPHNIAFPDLKKTSASTTGGITGNEVTLDLGSLKPGRYSFVCTYHVSAGMAGVLVVS